MASKVVMDSELDGIEASVQSVMQRLIAAAGNTDRWRDDDLVALARRAAALERRRRKIWAERDRA